MGIDAGTEAAHFTSRRGPWSYAKSPDRPERQKPLSGLSLLKIESFLRGKRSLALHRLITTSYFSPVVVPPFLST